MGRHIAVINGPAVDSDPAPCPSWLNAAMSSTRQLVQWSRLLRGTQKGQRVVTTPLVGANALWSQLCQNRHWGGPGGGRPIGVLVLSLLPASNDTWKEGRHKHARSHVHAHTDED